MSWLGDQFSSITGKLSDFTKEVLNEDAASGITEDISYQNGILSAKELSDLCKEKDQEIKNLMQEKDSLESSIEELAQQQQEAIDALLNKKDEVVAENKMLKEKLLKLDEKQQVTNGDFLTFDLSLLDKDLLAVLDKKINSTSETPPPESSEKSVDFLTLIKLFSNSYSEESLKDIIHWLENQKHLLYVGEEDKDNVNNSLNKINNYINFLQTVCASYESSFPVIEEVCGAFSFLLHNIVQLNQRISSVHDDKELIRKFCVKEDSLCDPSVDKATKLPILGLKITTTDSSTQMESCPLLSTVDFCVQTDSCASDVSICTEVTVCHSSKQSQTEKIDQGSLLKDHKFLNQLESSITSLELEKSELMSELIKLKSSYKTSASVFTETEERCRCDSLQSELDATRKSFSNIEQLYNTLEKEQTDNLKDFREKLQSRDLVISEKETIIQSQKKEIVSLISRVKSLAEEIKSLKSKVCTKEVTIAETADHMISSQIHLLNSSENGMISSSEVTNLQGKVSTLELEKGKLLCVLNEKSQECSSLKAEVHKLTTIVASEKQALFKLQKDNRELKDSNNDNSDPKLTKETIKKLSNIIRDKDFEIESLKQKNSTLTTLIQDASNIPDHLQSLLEEKENLSKQISLYKDEREKFMVNYNTKDKKCREYAAEVKELSSILSEQRDKFDVLEQKHLSVAQQYEDKQKSLINTQNEMIALKQRVSDLEHQQVDIKEKYGNLLNKLNADGMIQVTKDELSEKNMKIEQLTVANEEKDHLIQEKDCMIHDLSQQVKKLKLESEQQQEAIQNLGKKTSELMEKIVELKSAIEELQNEKQNFELRFQDKNSESALLKDMNERLNMALKEKEFAMQSMTEKISSLSQYINSDHSSSSGTMDINQILADSESMFSKAQNLYRERDETLLALHQSKQENQNLRNEIQRMKSSEIHLKNELQRLRQHLLEIEENYTSEAIKASDNEKRLQDELVEVRRRAEITSTAVVDTSQRASIQIASLQEQLSIIANQRDEALSQISSLEDEVIHHSTAVGKLQLVLEQMQKGNERKLKENENKWKLQLDKQKMTCDNMEQKLLTKQKQLEESSRALEAATRLSEQLDAKEEIIANLKTELSKTENKIKSTAQEIDSIKSNTEGKVDRVVMKSLVLGYFSTPPEQKSEVIRLLARVLDFNQEEMEKAGIVVGRHARGVISKGGIFSSIFSRLPSLTSQEQPQRMADKSFTALFVQFLENESQPIVPMPFPVERMTQELTLKTHPRKKSLDKTSPRRSPLLLDIDSAFPTFTPVPAVEYSTSSAPAVLKEVLE